MGEPNAIQAGGRTATAQAFALAGQNLREIWDLVFSSSLLADAQEDIAAIFGKDFSGVLGEDPVTIDVGRLAHSRWVAADELARHTLTQGLRRTVLTQPGGRAVAVGRLIAVLAGMEALRGRMPAEGGELGAVLGQARKLVTARIAARVGWAVHTLWCQRKTLGRPKGAQHLKWSARALGITDDAVMACVGEVFHQLGFAQKASECFELAQPDDGMPALLAALVRLRLAQDAPDPVHEDTVRAAACLMALGASVPGLFFVREGARVLALHAGRCSPEVLSGILAGLEAGMDLVQMAFADDEVIRRLAGGDCQADEIYQRAVDAIPIFLRESEVAAQAGRAIAGGLLGTGPGLK